MRSLHTPTRTDAATHRGPPRTSDTADPRGRGETRAHTPGHTQNRTKADAEAPRPSETTQSATWCQSVPSGTTRPGVALRACRLPRGPPTQGGLQSSLRIYSERFLSTSPMSAGGRESNSPVLFRLEMETLMTDSQRCTLLFKTPVHVPSLARGPVPGHAQVGPLPAAPQGKEACWFGAQGRDSFTKQDDLARPGFISPPGGATCQPQAPPA